MSKLNKVFKYSNIIFILFIFFLLIQAFDQSFGSGLHSIYPNIYFTTFTTPTSPGWNVFIWQENGLVETLQVIILFTTILVLLNFYFLKKKYIDSSLLKKFLIIEICGLIYLLFEEISWGQHALKFDTFKYFLDENNFFYNHQGEMNLHNTSRIFNEFPRILVMIWCSLSIIILKFSKLNSKKELIPIVIPNEKLIFISYLVLIFCLPDLILTKLGMVNHSELAITENEILVGYNFSVMFKIILSFNFFRLSELQELLFVYYFMWHSLFLRNLYFR